MARKVSEIKRKRDQALAAIERIGSFVGSDEKPRDQFEIQTRLDRLPVIFEQFEKAQLELELLVEDVEHETSVRIGVEEKYYSISAKFKQLLSEINNKTISTPNLVPNQGLSVPLPTINLPKFFGEYDRWVEFKDCFVATVANNKSLTDIQKFFHLRSCLGREVLETIQAIPVTNDNYQTAWQQLVDRYERGNLILNHHVNLILNFSPITKESIKDLRNLYNCVRNNLEALRNLGAAVEHWDLLLIPIIASKLDSQTRKEWEKFAVVQKNITVQDLLTLISNRCEFLERLDTKKANASHNQPPVMSRAAVSQGKLSKVFTTVVKACKVCNGNHPIFKCSTFLNMKVEERISKVKKLGLCQNCLRSGHFAKDCTSSKCLKCKNYHNTLLHKTKSEKPVVSSTDKVVAVARNQLHCHSASQVEDQVLLPTAMVLIADANDTYHKCKALLDTGAMSNFISKELCKKLKLQTSETNCSISGLGQITQTARLLTTITFRSCVNPESQFSTSCMVIDNITSNLPLFSFNKDHVHFPKNIKLADPTFNVSSPIDLLLGSEIVWQLFQDGEIKIPRSGPTLRNTKLGWVAGGHFPKSSSQFGTKQTSITCLSTSQDTLKELLQRFWETEEVKTDRPKSAEEKHCEELFVTSHKRDHDGRFVVKIPFKPNFKDLGDSREFALRRFLNLEKRLDRDTELRKEYNKIMQEYIAMGHMKEVTDESTEEVTYYIPHHAVVRKESLTTKTRVVFDASMKSTSGLSLNDVQFIGPCIQNEIFTTLLNFRLHKYVITSDISKMYRMIWIDEIHKPFHRIFWRNHHKEPLKCYELQTVTFGTASAPYLAIRCLHQIAEEHKKTHPKASQIIKNNFYVDDLLFGADSIQELVQVQHEITTILASAGFFLRKWLCNNEKIYSKLHLNPDMECNTIQLGDKSNKTLGVTWNAQTDKILYSAIQLNQRPYATKRIVLSDLSRLFDPLGLLGPVVVIGKLFIQRLWQDSHSWDDQLNEELTNQWFSIRAKLEAIKTITIERRVLTDGYQFVELHGFCDASEKAYGACIFVRSRNQQGKISTQLACSKSRVAPLKTISLPRLELCGALLLAQLMHKVSKGIDLKIDKIHYWTDSTIALAWIQGEPGKWKTFIANRVSEIHRLTEPQQWHHVSSADNPADILSRGATVECLVKNEMWWSGPQWLLNESLSLGKVEVPKIVPETKTAVFTTTVNTTDNIFDRYSSYQRLLRVTAYCLRFLKNCKKSTAQREVGELTVQEVDSSEHTLLRLMQRQCFPEEYHRIQNQKCLDRKSRLLQLNPFLDKTQLLRVGGRLERGLMEYDRKHQIILSPKHRLTKLMIKHIHFTHLHCGTTTLLAIIRQKYWPLDARNLVKGIIKACRVCFLAKPKAGQYLMGQLPRERITQCYPFQNVGVDYAGPIQIKDRKTRNPKTLKAYICLFVCLATKAVHLECVTELTTQGFFSCFRRFVSRRGKPQNIYSDNGKNFVGANRELRNFYSFLKKEGKNIDRFFVQERISWHFIPARSPSFGGIWEAGIKSMKHHLARTFRGTKFDYENLSTILCQIESILNSRPLTPLTSDPTDLTPLTPGHFLIGRTFTQVPEINSQQIMPTSRLKQYKHLQLLLKHFWGRWSKEYIAQLQIRSKWKINKKEEQDAAKVGRLVLIMEDSGSPLQWPLGRITEIHPGEDGVVRVVSVRLRDTIVKRSLHKICFLPEEEI